MADISIIFNDAFGTNQQLQVYADTTDCITVSLKDENANFHQPAIIQLSKSTAIKLHRELKKQISFLESEEVRNG